MRAPVPRRGLGCGRRHPPLAGLPGSQHRGRRAVPAAGRQPAARGRGPHGLRRALGQRLLLPPHRVGAARAGHQPEPGGVRRARAGQVLHGRRADPADDAVRHQDTDRRGREGRVHPAAAGARGHPDRVGPRQPGPAQRPGPRAARRPVELLAGRAATRGARRGDRPVDHAARRAGRDPGLPALGDRRGGAVGGDPAPGRRHRRLHRAARR